VSGVAGAILITGGSGFLGRALTPFLRERGWTVRRLLRRELRPGGEEFAWNPARGDIDASAFKGARAVVHLAGENIAGGLWTPAKKERIRKSRIDGTRLVARAIRAARPAPEVLVSASATGWYGNRPEGVVDELTPAGGGFLADVCREWEDAALEAASEHTRVVPLRLGVVLDPAGGMLRRLLPFFRLGLGGRIGSGRQPMSWVALADLLRVVEFALGDEGLSGPVNATSPRPVTNAEFTRAIGRAVHRPTLLPVPAWTMRLLPGEMGEELLLSGCRAQPARLIERGFRFEYEDVSRAVSRGV